MKFVSIIWAPRWLRKKKCLNYKIVELIEIYSFHMKFISIRVHIISYDSFKMSCLGQNKDKNGGGKFYPVPPVFLYLSCLFPYLLFTDKYENGMEWEKRCIPSVFVV